MVRRWKAAPLPAEIIENAWREPASSVSRIITPAFAQPSVFSSETTRAMISPSPVSRTIDEMKRVGVVPDVVTAAGDREGVIPAHGVAEEPDVADVLACSHGRAAAMPCTLIVIVAEALLLPMLSTAATRDLMLAALRADPGELDTARWCLRRS